MIKNGGYIKVLMENIKPYTWIMGIVLLLIVWIVLSASGIVGKTLLASPFEVMNAVQRAFAKDAHVAEKFHVHAWYTIQRAFQGWSIGILGGSILGIFIGSLQVIYFGIEPIAEFIRAIPPILAFPLFLVAFNYSNSAYIWTIVFGCLPVMMLTVARGTLSISSERIDILKSFNVSKNVRIFTMAMEITPSIFLGARLTLSWAIIISVVTEMVFTPRSGLALGSLARDAEIEFNTPVFYACVLTIGIFGYLSNLLMRKLEQWLGFTSQTSIN